MGVDGCLAHMAMFLYKKAMIVTNVGKCFRVYHVNILFLNEINMYLFFVFCYILLKPNLLHEALDGFDQSNIFRCLMVYFLCVTEYVSSKMTIM